MALSDETWRTGLAAGMAVLALTTNAAAHPIQAKSGNAAKADFDIVGTEIALAGDELVFRMAVSGKAGASRPAT